MLTKPTNFTRVYTGGADSTLYTLAGAGINFQSSGFFGILGGSNTLQSRNLMINATVNVRKGSGAGASNVTAMRIGILGVSSTGSAFTYTGSRDLTTTHSIALTPNDWTTFNLRYNMNYNDVSFSTGLGIVCYPTTSGGAATVQNEQTGDWMNVAFSVTEMC